MRRWILLWLILLIISLYVSLSLGGSKQVSVGKDTMKLCREYANRDHEKELAPDRWEYLKQFGDPNDHEFFYQSCIGHITGIPATKEYMK